MKNKITSLILSSLLILSMGLVPQVDGSIEEVRCKNHQSNYITLGEIAYKERYNDTSIVKKCIELFTDIKSKLYVKMDKKVTPFKINDVKPTGGNASIIQYTVCNDTSTVKTRIILNSLWEKSLIILSKQLPSTKCTDFWIKTTSENIKTITLSWDSGVDKYLKVKKILLFNRG